MRKFLLLTLAVALVPAFSPAKASPATLAQRVSAFEAKLACPAAEELLRRALTSARA
ncbi:MAG TPA: hypothetical protein VJU01_05085 [Gaiellaceae bacterium]|nr:hypothetical protein [Gaiellaceae bacterium]